MAPIRGPFALPMHDCPCCLDVHCIYAFLSSFQLTTLITAFITKIRSSIKNGTFLSQIARIGIIASFEGLLSCHGDEMGMLEDMVIAVNDLNNVKFRIVHSAETEKILPRIVVDRYVFSLNLCIPLI